MSDGRASGPGAVRRWLSRPVVWLYILVVAFFAISLYAGVVSYYDFQLANAGDAGIITQAVASTTHGGVPQMFESWDCQFKQRCSFLLVHPAFVLYGAVPAFALAPNSITIFAIRAAVVAAAALPLYWLTRQLTGSDRVALLAAGIFLIWAPTSTDDFSLHMEAFLPLELLLLAALWQAGRYRTGLLVAFIAFMTLEIAPVFTFLIGVFFLAPSAGTLWRETRQRWRARATEGFSVVGEFRRYAQVVRSAFGGRLLRYTAALMIASIAAYIFLYSFMNVWGPHVLGVASPTTGTGLLGLFYNPSSPSVAPIPTILTSPQTIATAEYWILLYGLLAFIPLLSPRALIVSVPWIGWTFLTNSDRFTSLGHQYSFIAAGPIFIGFAYGLQYLYQGPLRPRSAPYSTPSRPRTRWLPASPRTRRATLGGVVAVVVIANALLIPFNPLLPALGYKTGEPVEPLYFQHSLTIQPGWAEANQMVNSVPRNATLEVPGTLLALVADRPNVAIVRGRMPGATWLLPFNDSNGPAYTIVYPALTPPLTTRDFENLSNPAIYQMRAYVASTTLGPLLMYERGYVGVARSFGPPMGPNGSLAWSPGNGMTAGPIGAIAPNSTSPSGKVIESSLAAHSTGLVWTGSAGFLGPGSYVFQVTVAVQGVNGTVRPSAVVLQLAGSGFGLPIFLDNVTFSQLSAGGWTTLSFNATLTDPLPVFAITGALRDPNCSIAVGSIAISGKAAP
jgi:uncharacterized membrane protein